MKSRRVLITDHSFTLSSSEDAFHFYPTLSVFIRYVFPYFLCSLCLLRKVEIIFHFWLEFCGFFTVPGV